MNAVCAYKITNLRGTDDEVTLVIDMRQNSDLQNGAIVLNPRDDTESKIRQLGVATQPDMCFVLSEGTWDRLYKKEISGFRATM